LIDGCVCVGGRRVQLVSYERERQSSLQRVLCEFAEAKIELAKDTYTLLQQSLQYFTQLSLD